METRECSCTFGGNVNWYSHYGRRYGDSFKNLGIRPPCDPAIPLLVIYPAAAAAKLLQSCPTLCNPIDGSPPGFPVPGILQARTLEWVATSFSNAWKWKVKVKSLSRVWLLATPWTAAYQAPPSMGFSRQKYWSGLPLPSPVIYPEETKIEKDTCTPLFIAALFTIAKTWKQPRCPSTDEWIKKLWYICTMEYYSTMKKEDIWVISDEVDEPRTYYT